MNNIDHMSAVVLVKDNEHTLAATLESLKAFDNVVVYDNGSTDESKNIARKFSNVHLVEGEFKGFGWTKNRAVSFAEHDWIIIVDSDEVVDKELLQTLQTKRLDDNTVYQLNFKAYYKDIQVKHCGWNNQKIKRVFNRNVTKYNNNDVHEDIMTDGLAVELLAGNMEHYSYHSISEFIIKADRYSTLFAQNNVGKRASSPLKAFFNGVYSFIRTYVFKKGFLDGYVGLIISYSHMVTNFYKYMKLYEMNKELKK